MSSDKFAQGKKILLNIIKGRDFFAPENIIFKHDRFPKNKKKGVQKALDLIAPFAKSNPNDKKAQFLVGKCYFTLGNMEKAQEAFQKVVQQAGGDRQSTDELIEIAKRCLAKIESRGTVILSV